MQSHEAWISFAHEDLKAAKGLLKLELFSAVTYHSQQCAEKSLKAYLIFKNHQIIRTHDLLQLLELCIKFDKGFEKLFDAVNLLNPFSTKFRYPSEHDLPDKDDAQTTVQEARKIIKFIAQKTSPKNTGQISLLD